MSIDFTFSNSKQLHDTILQKSDEIKEIDSQLLGNNIRWRIVLIEELISKGEKSKPGKKSIWKSTYNKIKNKIIELSNKKIKIMQKLKNDLDSCSALKKEEINKLQKEINEKKKAIARGKID